MILEAPPPRSALSVHTPRIIPGRERHCAVDDWRPFEEFATEFRSGFVDFDGCAVGMRDPTSGELIMKTTRLHAFGDGTLEAAQRCFGPRDCTRDHVHARIMGTRATNRSIARRP